MNYFDHAATTPLHPEVIEVMLKTMKETFGNPSSIHQYGRKAHEILEEARQIIATSLNVQSNEIIFTSLAITVITIFIAATLIKHG